MVVDDESAVREVTAELLTSMGFGVLQAEGGGRACELFAEHGASIDLVLLDMTMPDMDGEQTLQALRALRPDVRVVVMTGYAEEDAAQRFSQHPFTVFVAKPFARRELVAAIQRARADGTWGPS